MRFCMFCGEEIPEQAMFCPSCGAKQPDMSKTSPAPQPEKDEEDGDEDNIALNILNKANFSSKGGTGKSIIPGIDKKPEKKAIRIEPEVENPVEKVEEKKYEEPLIDEEDIQEYNSAPELIITDDPDDEDDYDEEQERKRASLFAQLEHRNEYVPPILDEISEKQNEARIDEKQKELAEERKQKKEEAAKELEAIEKNLVNKNEENKSTTNSSKLTKSQDKKKNEGELPPVPGEERKNTTRKPIYKKRNLSEEDESENEDIHTNSMKATSSLILDGGDSDLTADEKADIEKHKKYKAETVDEDDSLPGEGRIKGEGRKKGGRKKEVRKNVDKEIAKRRINDIEHEEVSKKDEVDADYDGYYENVKPIDFDKMRDNTAVVKTAITGAIAITLACVVFYLLFTFFMQ